MRFLFTLAYPEWTGPAEPMAQLSIDLIGRGHSVTIWTDGKREGDLHRRLIELGLNAERPLNLCRKSGPLAIARDIARAGDLIRDRFDCVVTHMSADQMIIGQTRRSHKVPVLRYIQNMASNTTRPGRGLLLRNANGLLVPSSDHAQRAAHLSGFPTDKIGILRGAVDLDTFPLGSNDQLRRRMQLNDDDLLLISVSRQKPERRQMDLLEALAQARRQRNDLHLALIGRGEFQPELKLAVERLKLGDAVLFAGYAQGDELPHAFQSCDASVWLAEGNDGTCRAVGQSLASGKPVIGARVGAIADALEPHPMAGWLCKPKDITGLTQILIDLPHRKELAQRAGALRGVAETEWSLSSRTESFLEICERFCA